MSINPVFADKLIPAVIGLGGVCLGAWLSGRNAKKASQDEAYRKRIEELFKYIRELSERSREWNKQLISAVGSGRWDDTNDFAVKAPTHESLFKDAKCLSELYFPYVRKYLDEICREEIKLIAISQEAFKYDAPPYDKDHSNYAVKMSSPSETICNLYSSAGNYLFELSRQITPQILAVPLCMVRTHKT